MTRGTARRDGDIVRYAHHGRVVNGGITALAAGTELGKFLKVRRALVAPVEGGSRRRVPGLRREEVAALAGVSADYYTRLEQGRHKRPSEAVLHSLADALQLDELATRHLFDLARAVAAPQRRVPKATVQRVRPSLHRLLDTFTEHPAFIRGRRTDVLAMNSLAALLLTDFPAKPARERNLLRWALLDGEARRRYVDWEKSPRRWSARCASMPAATPTTRCSHNSSVTSRYTATSSAHGGPIIAWSSGATESNGSTIHWSVVSTSSTRPLT